MSIGSGEFQFVFTTRAELAGARQVEEQIQRDIGKAKALGKDYSELEAQLKKVQAAIAAAGKPAGPGVGEMFTKIREGLGEVIPGFQRLDGLLSKFAGGALGAIAGGFAVLAGGLEAAKHSLEEYAGVEERVAKLDAALAQRGQLNSEYREELQELAAEMQRTTTIAKGEWLAVLTRLTQFGADPENIREYSDAVKNLAGILGGDIQTAANLVSRAMQGNFAMFARYGIQVEEAGDKTEKLEKLFQQLAGRGGGQLEASAKTINGQFRDLKNNASELWEAFGRGIARTGVLQSGLELLSDVFESIAERLGGPVAAIDGLGNAAISTKQRLEEAASSDEYEKRLKAIEAAAEVATLRLNGLREAARLEAEQEEKIAQAKKKQDIADVDKAVAKHEITKEEGDRRKGLIEAADITGKGERGKQLLETNDYFDRQELNTAIYKSMVADRRVQVAEAQAKQFDSLDPQRRITGQRESDYQKDLDKKKQIEQELKEPVGAGVALAGLPGGLVVGNVIDNARKKELREKLEALNQNLPKEKILAEDAREDLNYMEKEAGPDGTRGKELKRLKDEADKARQDAAKAQQEFDNRRRNTNIQKSTVEQATPIERGAEETKSEAEQTRQREEDEKKRIEEQIKLHGKSAAAAQTGQAIVTAIQDLHEGYTGALEDVLGELEKARQEIAVLRDQASVRS